jgi:hypothetical protein
MTKHTTLGLGTVTLGVIVALAALLLFASTALAAGSISGSTQNIAAGGTATVTITETSPTGLGNWLIDAAVDAGKLGVPTCTNVIAGGTCNVVSGNVVRFAGADGSATGITGTQTVGTITVTATAALTTGCSDIALTITAFEDGTGTAIASPTVTNGQVCIAVVTNSPSPSASPVVTAKTVPATGGPAGDSSSISLSLLLGAAGLIVVAGGAWTVARARREEN